MKHPALLPVLLSLAAAFAAPACECDSVGCLDEVIINLDGTWSEGRYDFELDVDGRKDTCVFEVRPGVALEQNGQIYCAKSEGRVTAMPNGRVQLEILSPATNVEVRVSRDGSVFIIEQLTPVYMETADVNGAFCGGGTCRASEVTLSF